MDARRQVLLVIRTPRLANSLFKCLDESCFGVTLATTFAAAKTHLDASPDLVITELKLGEYNGLHLALRARTRGIPAIIIGQPDVMLEHEAELLGAAYIGTADVQPADLVELVERAACSDAHGESGGRWLDDSTANDDSSSWMDEGAAGWSMSSRSPRRPVLH